MASGRSAHRHRHYAADTRHAPDTSQQTLEETLSGEVLPRTKHIKTRQAHLTSPVSRARSSTPTGDGITAAVLDYDAPIIEIASHGDLVLRIEHTINESTISKAFRVDSQVLRTHSKYFASLLQPGRFSEADTVEDKHKSLREQYRDLAAAPAAELPTLSIEDVGRISVKSLGPLLADFFHVLHGMNIQNPPPIANLANIAIVADRFDALEMVKTYVQRKKTFRTLEGKTTAKQDQALSEEKVRQRLLVGLLLDDSSWVDKYSFRIMSKGWVGKDVPISAALWWDLPSRIEEELAYRRDCVLETVQSLLSHFLTLYTSRERQCKLGYDSSPQCDSFQLGEMMRFFVRTGTLQLRGTIIDTEEPPESYAGDLDHLLDTLRQVPEYQIDKFHSHCGIRTKLVPLLDLLQRHLSHAGICIECWQDRRLDYAWLGAKRPLLWKKEDRRLLKYGHGDLHVGTRDLFTATERAWS